MSEVVVVHTPTFVDVVENLHAVEVVQEQYVVEVYAAVGQPGPRGLVGQRGPGLPIVFARRAQVDVMEGRLKYRMPFAATLLGVSAAMGEGTPPVGANMIVHIKCNGVAFATLTILDGAEEAPEMPIDFPVVVGDFLTVDITQVGSVQPGEDLSIFITYGV